MVPQACLPGESLGALGTLVRTLAVGFHVLAEAEQRRERSGADATGKRTVEAVRSAGVAAVFMRPSVECKLSGVNKVGGADLTAERTQQPVLHCAEMDP